MSIMKKSDHRKSDLVNNGINELKITLLVLVEIFVFSCTIDHFKAGLNVIKKHLTIFTYF